MPSARVPSVPIGPRLMHVGARSMRGVLVGCAVVFLLTALAGPERAWAQDVLNSPPCESARRELEAALGAPAGRGSDDQVRLKLQIDRSRGLVAQRCFGREADAPISDRAAQAPVAAPLIGVPRAPAAAAGRAAPPPVQVQRPATLGVCDSTGCWDSSGTRLNSSGPVLMGPSGTCVAQAGTVNCN